MQFEMLKEKSSIIKVIGVGGGETVQINHMYQADYYRCRLYYLYY